MDTKIFLLIYICLIIIMICIEFYLLSNNKFQHLKTSYKAMKTICEDADNKDINVLKEEINRFYCEYVQEQPQIVKFFPNVVVWMDAIIFRISCGYKHANILKGYITDIKSVRDLLQIENPFNQCEKFQQGILSDIDKIKTDENNIVVQNIIDRTKEEFLRLSQDINKNRRLNIVSISIGIIGIAVSILMTVMSF